MSLKISVVWWLSTLGTLNLIKDIYIYKDYRCCVYIKYEYVITFLILFIVIININK